MNFLKALEKETPENITPFQEKKTHIVVNNEYIDNVDEMYYKNVKDSVITYHLPELQHMCEDFVKETLFLDCPMLAKHHQGYKNFVVEMMSIYENHTDVAITEMQDEDGSDSEAELDPSDITDTKNENNTF